MICERRVAAPTWLLAKALTDPFFIWKSGKGYKHYNWLLWKVSTAVHVLRGVSMAMRLVGIKQKKCNIIIDLARAIKSKALANYIQVS